MSPGHIGSSQTDNSVFLTNAVTTHPALFPEEIGGGERVRTDDLLLAKQALSQLSYTPVYETPRHKVGCEMVGLGRLELPTSRLSGVRSNQAELQAHSGSNQLVERAYTVSAFGILNGRDTPAATCRHLC